MSGIEYFATVEALPRSPKDCTNIAALRPYPHQSRNMKRESVMTKLFTMTYERERDFEKRFLCTQKFTRQCEEVLFGRQASMSLRKVWYILLHRYVNIS